MIFNFQITGDHFNHVFNIYADVSTMKSATVSQ